MTKEEILNKFLTGYPWRWDSKNNAYKAMQEYADQQTTSLKAEVESLKSQLAEKDKEVVELRASKMRLRIEHQEEKNELKQQLDYSNKTIDLLLHLKDIKDKKLAKAEADKARTKTLEHLLLSHQCLTQWIEEEISDENDNVLECSHDFLQNLFWKVHKLNH
jgi:hypothetical protein